MTQQGIREAPSALHDKNPSRYLAVQHQKLFKEIEGLIEDVEATLEEVSRGMLKTNDIEVSFRGLVKFLHDKKLKRDELKA
ncbi:unnamed protein product [Dovyalis caffra]|uniref:AAA+ ATPase At3g28540-like C-terminal domain-containing protein n=1 Tax=Dovyalis caffra TaxID=77055 RepID=A0AAV1R1R9_9ROSI|nr:unnamed protein product [Dovyalis caffra]